MIRRFEVGDHVGWNSKAGHMHGKGAALPASPRKSALQSFLGRTKDVIRELRIAHGAREHERSDQ
ncbi:hypothetical protein ABIB82_000711 [Bradyrhizobium sp. i1.8.4]